MSFLLLIGIVILIIWYFNRGKSTPPRSDNQLYNQYDRLNQQWIDFIAAYLAAAKTPAEKALLERMLADVKRQGMGEPAITIVEGSGDAAPVTHTSKPAIAQAATQAIATDTAVNTQPIEEYVPSKPNVQLDNATLLLYFGAFLFVASVGLFVAVGGASGVLRAFLVLFVMIVMYGGGIWLFKNRSKLEQAGLAFAAIGIVMAPLVGLAFYNFVFNHQHANEVWLITSIACLGLYVHALFTLRKPLISYLLIFTFLSLFESSISMISVPVYYLGWGLAAVGIMLHLLNLWKGYWPELKESSRQSSMVLLPVSLFAAIVMVPAHGAMQLGFAFVLAAAFYGLEALTSSRDDWQQESAIASHVMVLTAIGTFTYASQHTWQSVAYALLACNIVQAVALLFVKFTSSLWRNYATVLLVSAGASIALAIQHPPAILATTAGLTAIASVIWLRQKRVEVYGLAILGFLSLPYIYGLLVTEPQLSVHNLTCLAGGAMAIVFAIYLFGIKRWQEHTDWLTVAQTTYVVGALGLIATSFFGSPLLCLVTTLGVVASLIVLAERDRTSEWAVVAGALLAVPIVASWDDGAMLLTSILVVLTAVLGMALRYRQESLRWEGTALWLVVPVCIGHATSLLATTSSSALFTHWSAQTYTFAYLLVMCALIFSRALARGLVLFSSARVLSSYAKSASLSYVFGYCIAAFAAIVCSINTDSPHVYTTAVLLILMLVTVFVSRIIEKRVDILALIPLLAQATLLSVVQPWLSTGRLNLLMILSSSIAAIGYVAIAQYQSGKPHKHELEAIQTASLVALFFTPISALSVGTEHWPMPIGMLLAAGVSSYHVRAMGQELREVVGALFSLAAWWFLALFHVHEVQAYIHVVIINLGVYAYWRTQRGETKEADNYLLAMLATATIPLALQAISGAAGGLYGWWLLLEQIVFMLLGMAIGKRFVTLWGLYVAVAAVLYQLRHLGWAALTLLAIFLIGIALYQLQKHSDKD